MNIYKSFLSGMFLALLLVLSGCQGNNSETADANVTSPTVPNTNTQVDNTDNTVDVNGTISLVILNGTAKVLTENSEQASISINVVAVDNSPYSEGNVSVAYPDKVRNGVDVGSFVYSSVAIKNGVATFNYTGPKNLQELVDSGDLSTVFGFYHTSDVKSIKYYTLTYSPIPNQIVLTDYFLKESASSSNYTMALESSRQMSFYVEDDKGVKIDDSATIGISVKLLNPSLGELKDTVNRTGDELIFTKNNVSVSLLSSTRSGVVPIEVNATFLDVNKAVKNIIEVFNVTILSGPPTAMSISYEGTANDEPNAKFQENMIITVTDKYFNAVNTQPAVSTYLIAGYALENSADPDSRIYFETTDTKSGTMNPTNNTLTSTANFSNVDLANEFLLTYANGYTYNVSGKWDIESINGGELTLADKIDASSNVEKIGFAIGSNYRQDTCRDGKEWLGYVTLTSDRLDTNGIVKAVINYDYYLTGKSVMLGIDIVGYTANGDITSKFGEASKHTLRSTGFESAVCSVSAGAINALCRIPVEISDTGEWYRNANMGFGVKGSDNISIISITSSNWNVHDCTNSGGVAYVDVVVTETKDTAGSVSLENIVVGSEF